MHCGSHGGGDSGYWSEGCGGYGYEGGGYSSGGGGYSIRGGGGGYSGGKRHESEGETDGGRYGRGSGGCVIMDTKVLDMEVAAVMAVDTPVEGVVVMDT
ncbi:hypothetical protein F2Q68_00015135 [Brassica cretica]|uniref:Uncharacterized protein n=1 Tax=Brassica cretica TaxID=69181 RepID=A0A8S9HKZ7_BRACR|nr:hypothetical protein F2Q68_00015135 [Brassica cretica]